MNLGRLRIALAVSLVPVLLVGVAAPISLAEFTSAARVATSTFTAGYWANYFLHDKPTPPSKDNKANPNDQMSLTTTTPSATTLYNYSTNCAGTGGGRALTSGTGADCDEADWRLTSLPAATPAGTANVRIWTRGTGTFVFTIRTGSPAGPSVGSSSVVLTDTGSWAQRDVAISVAAIAQYAKVYLVLTAASGITNGRLAYDTTTYRSILSLP